MNTIHKTLCESLAALFEASGMLKRELADRAGVSERSLADYLTGRTFPGDKLDALLRVLGLKDTELMWDAIVRMGGAPPEDKCIIDGDIVGALVSRILTSGFKSATFSNDAWPTPLDAGAHIAIAKANDIGLSFAAARAVLKAVERELRRRVVVDVRGIDHEPVATAATNDTV